MSNSDSWSSPHYVPAHVPQIYISREPAEHIGFDITLLGFCDKVVAELCKRAGWELKHEMVPRGHEAEVVAAARPGTWHVRS